MATTNNSDQHEAESCFHEWMVSEENCLNNLIEALTQGADDDINPDKEKMLKEEVERAVRNFEGYICKRSLLCRRDVSNYMAPTWTSCLENSLMWIGGCRPSSFIRLVYSLWGSDVKSQLGDLDLVVPTTDKSVEYGLESNNVSFGDLSLDQLSMVNELQMKTIGEEDKLATRLAIVQEDSVELPIAIIGSGGSNQEVDRTLDKQETAMIAVLEEAEKLRMSTLMELLKILKPLYKIEIRKLEIFMQLTRDICA